MRSWLSLIPGIILSLRASAAMFSNGDQNPPYGGYKCMDVAGAKPGDGTPAQSLGLPRRTEPTVYL